MAAGLRQQDVAAQVGISRQSLSQLESGRSVPSTGVALRLARVLGCRTEDLFWIDDDQPMLTADLAGANPATTDGAPADSAPELVGPRGSRRVRKSPVSRPKAASETRVLLASLNGRWVAHRLEACDQASFLSAADGVMFAPARADATAVRVKPLLDPSTFKDTLLCAGCAPAFGILTARANVTQIGGRVAWLDRSSGEALELLARGQIHVAGAHLYDEPAREFNVPFVERRLPGRSMLIFNLARWDAGLVVAPGNPRQVRGVRDLVRPDLSFVGRQAGAAAQDLVERLLRRQGLPADGLVRRHVTARSHMEVARLVALGLADVGVGLAAVARAHGLDFIPIAEERFDLVLAKDLAGDPRVVRLLETLTSRGFRRELQSLGGHVARDAGRLVAETAGPH